MTGWGWLGAVIRRLRRRPPPHLPSGWRLLSKHLVAEPAAGSLLVIESNLLRQIYHCSEGREWVRKTNDFVATPVGYNPTSWEGQPETCWFIVPACPGLTP